MVLKPPPPLPTPQTLSLVSSRGCLGAPVVLNLTRNVYHLHSLTHLQLLNKQASVLAFKLRQNICTMQSY